MAARSHIGPVRQWRPAAASAAAVLRALGCASLLLAGVAHGQATSDSSAPRPAVSAQVSAGALVEPPAARPPEGLEGLPGTAADIAQHHLTQAEVLAVLVERSVAALATQLADARPGAFDCEQALATAYGISIAVREAGAHMRTARALSESLDRWKEATAPDADLRTRLKPNLMKAQELSASLESLACSAPATQQLAPRYRVTDDSDVGGLYPVFVGASSAGELLWVDGEVVSSFDRDRWTVAVVRSGVHRFCVAAPGQESCAPERQLAAVFAAALEFLPPAPRPSGSPAGGP